MRQKKVWRYYCDFCKKAGCNKYWIVKHESRCTKNPNRTCGYCALRELPQPEMASLLVMLPNPENHQKCDGFGFTGLDATFGTAIREALPKLREATENCPACIMAALRQKGIPVPMAEGFNFKKECESIWSDFNAAQRESDEREAYYS